jgi:hypothetical protein
VARLVASALVALAHPTVRQPFIRSRLQSLDQSRVELALTSGIEAGQRPMSSTE